MGDTSSLDYPAAITAVILFLIVAYVQSVVRWRVRTRGLPFPPGPKPMPIVGNMFDIPKSRPWVGYRELCSQFGDILHLRVFGQSVVVLGSAGLLFEYLDKRSANTSDRKQTPMIELSGSSLNLGFMPYGQWWRRHRRAFWQYFNREAAGEYKPAQCAVTRIFLKKLLHDPVRLKEHIRYTFAAAVLKVAYGIDAAEDNDKYVATVEDALEGPVQGLVPGRFLVDFLPFLKHIPPWFPGASSQRLWAKWQAAAHALKNLPFDYVKSTQDGAVSRSVVGRLLTRLSRRLTQTSLEEEEEIVKNVGAIAFEAGADTVYSTLQSAFVAMVLNPEVLAKAHAELDAVVGPYRLPDFSDKEELVYINAIVKEALRWHTVLPIGVPHCTVADDEFHGYFIPASTVLIPNTWACLRDPEAYDDPETFQPERFIRDGNLDPTVRDPSAFAFGYGRRICPGRYFAEAALFINIACALHVFDISPPLDEHSNIIEIKRGHTDGLISYPEDCRCTIKPRSAAAKALILSHATPHAEVDG